MADKNFNLNINLTTGESKAEVNRLNKELADLKKSIVDNQNAAKNSSVSMGASFSSLLGPLAALTAGFIGVRAIGNFFSESIQGANEQEKSLIKLGQALRATNSYSDEAVTAFSNFADELEGLTGIQGEVVIESIAMAKQMGTTNQQARDLTLAAANLAATFGGDLTSRTVELGKAFNGNIGRLGQLIPELKNLTREQLAAGAAADIINKKFGGNAVAAGDTFSGAVGRISKAWSDLQKTVGTAIINSPDFKTSLENVAAAIKRIGEAAAEAMPPTIKFISNVAKGFNDLYDQFDNDNVNTLTERLVTLNIQMVETQGEIDNLKKKYQDANIVDKLFMPSQEEMLVKLQNHLAKITGEYDSVLLKISGIQSETSKGTKTIPGGGGGVATVDNSVLEKRAELNNQLALVEAQAQSNMLQAQLDFQGELDANTDENLQKKLERYAQEQTDAINQQYIINDIIYQGELQKAQTLDDADARDAAREIAAYNRRMANSKAETELAKKQAKATADFKKLEQENSNKNLALGLDFAAALMKDGSKEQFLIQKAAQLAQIWVGYGTAMGLIPAQVATIPDMTPTQSVRMAAAARLTSQNLTSALLGTGIVAAQTIKGFAGGGTVTGGVAGKDSVPAMLMPNEEVLPVPIAKAFRDFVYNIDDYRLGTGAVLNQLTRLGGFSQAPVVYLNGTKLNKETGFESNLRLTVQ